MRITILGLMLVFALIAVIVSFLISGEYGVLSTTIEEVKYSACGNYIAAIRFNARWKRSGNAVNLSSLSRTVALIDCTSAKRISTLESESKNPINYFLRFHSDRTQNEMCFLENKLLVHDRGKIKYINWRATNPIARTIPLPIEVNALAFEPNEQLLLVANHTTLMLYSLETDSILWQVITPDELPDPQLVLSGKSNLFCYATIDTIFVGDLASGTINSSLKCKSPIQKLGFANSGSTLAIQCLESIEFVDLPTISDRSNALSTHSRGFGCDKECLVAFGSGASLEVYDFFVKESQVISTSTVVTSICFSPDGKRVSVGSTNASVTEYDLESGQRNWVCNVPGRNLTTPFLPTIMLLLLLLIFFVLWHRDVVLFKPSEAQARKFVEIFGYHP